SLASLPRRTNPAAASRSLYRLLSESARWGHYTFSQELFTGSRLGASAVRPYDAVCSQPRAFSGESLCNREGRFPTACFVLVLGTRPRRGQRILGQVLPGRGLNPDESQ